MHHRFLFALAALMAAGCSPPPPSSAYYNHGGPDQLLDASTEVKNVNIATAADMKALSSWAMRDKPSRAELYCQAANTNCAEAKRLLELHHVPVTVVPSPDNTATLVYERVVAHDCDQRYHDSSHDQYFVNAPDYGCSIAANIVQHVSDKQQFVNPGMMDNPRATGAVNTYNGAYKTQAAQQQQPGSYDLNQSTLGQVSQTTGQ